MIEVENANTYDLFFENLIPVVSGGPSNMPYAFNGVVYKYLAGLRFKNTPNGLIVYPILSTEKGKKAVLKCEPPITLRELPDMFYDSERLVHYLKNNLVKLNILPDGTRIVPRFETRIIEIRDVEE